MANDREHEFFDELDTDEPQCLAGEHCMGCGLKNCPVNQDVELWERELRQAGWRNTMPSVWQSPSGHYFRGPYKAWTLLHSHPELSIKHKSWQDVAGSSQRQ